MDVAEPLRALIIEDVEDDVHLLVNALKRSGFDPDFSRVDNREALIGALDDDWDIVFSDYTMPGFDGMEALELVRRHRDDLPLIFISGTIGEDRAVEAVKAGAHDYIIKGNYKRLPVAVNHALNEARMRREHQLAQARIHELINIDTLTDTASRGFFLETLIESLETARENGERVGVFYINIDDFRSINDGIGITGGDMLIAELARRLSRAVAPGDLVARLYADQFAVIVNEIRDTNRVDDITSRLLDCFSEPFSINRYNKKVSGSIGYCLFPDDGDDLQDLVNNATLAQARAKRTKRSSCLKYDAKFREEYEHRASLENELEQAIHRNEFVLHYQPQMDLQTGRILGVESLVRWNHPRKGLISPMEFIPLAEETGLILPLGNEICRLACRQMTSWADSGLLDIRMAINISSQQFQQEECAPNLLNIITQYGSTFDHIDLEITETALMSNPDIAFATMTELSRMGASITLDDFGTGYSSLSYLDRFPIDILKIDRSFVSGLPRDHRKAAIVHVIIAMAEKLDMKVVAEGIETPEQLHFLRETSCDMAQGYYIQRPVAADEILPVLMERTISR